MKAEKNTGVVNVATGAPVAASLVGILTAVVYPLVSFLSQGAEIAGRWPEILPGSSASPSWCSS
jgi:hypothetical protein